MIALLTGLGKDCMTFVDQYANADNVTLHQVINHLKSKEELDRQLAEHSQH